MKKSRSINLVTLIKNILDIYEFNVIIGKDYTINLKSDMVKQFQLKFNESLSGSQTLESLFASIIPLQ